MHGVSYKAMLLVCARPKETVEILPEDIFSFHALSAQNIYPALYMEFLIERKLA